MTRAVPLSREKQFPTPDSRRDRLLSKAAPSLCNGDTCDVT